MIISKVSLAKLTLLFFLRLFQGPNGLQGLPGLAGPQGLPVSYLNFHRNSKIVVVVVFAAPDLLLMLLLCIPRYSGNYAYFNAFSRYGVPFV